MPIISPVLLICLPIGITILIHLLLCRIYRLNTEINNTRKKKRNLYFAQKETKGRHKNHRGKHISIYFNRPSKKITPKIKERTLYDFEYTSSINKHKFHQARIPSSSKTAMDYSLITKNASKHSLPDLESKPIHESSLKQIERQPTSIHSTRTSDSSLPNYFNEPPVSRFSVRRKSVFAEAYDPEDDDDDGQRVVFPKSDEQRQRLADSVKNILLFRSLDKEQMNEVLDAMFEKKVLIGDYIIKQGDDGDNFYVIESGIYNTFVDNQGQPKLIHTYDNKGSFGELALLYNMPRAATIQAVSEGSLWAMDRQTFRRIVLKSAFKKRKMYETLIDCVPMLKTLQSYERMNLADALVPKSFDDGEIIIKQGDAADGMYFVEAGTIKITILDEDGKEIEIKTISKGGYFGELALVTHKPRAASAYAVGPTKLAFLDVEAFERLLGPCMQIMKRNINDYESQLLKIFGSNHNITDVR